MRTFIRPLLGAVLLALLPAAALGQATTTPAPSAPAAPATGEAPKAPADAAASSGHPLAACRPDIEKLCASAPKGGFRKCLDENAAKLSPACTAARTDLEAKIKAIREACAEDVRTHCASAGKGKGGSGIVQCLRANEAKISPACSSAMKARYGKS